MCPATANRTRSAPSPVSHPVAPLARSRDPLLPSRRRTQISFVGSLDRLRLQARYDRYRADLTRSLVTSERRTFLSLSVAVLCPHCALCRRATGRLTLSARLTWAHSLLADWPALATKSQLRHGEPSAAVKGTSQNPIEDECSRVSEMQRWQ